MKRAIGRPTKYNPDMIIEATDYIDSCGREAMELPTITGLALRLGVDDERISEWAKEYPEFHATVKALKAKQQDQLMNDGMYGGKEVNSTMAIFLLKVNHGMVETTHTDITTGGRPLLQYDLNGKYQLNETNQSTAKTAASIADIIDTSD